MLDLLKVLELQNALEKNGDDRLRFKGLYNALNSLTVELAKVEDIDLT